MPMNPKTNKTDRHRLPQQELLDFRIKQKAERHMAALKKGRQHARDLPDAGEPEPSVPVPSPLAPLTGLGVLTLDSGMSSAADTPAKSPTTVPQHPSPAPSTAPKAAGKSAPKPPVTTPTHHSAGFVVEVPSASQFLRAAHRQPLHSHSNASPARNDGSLATRIAAVEKRQEKLEKWLHDIKNRLNQLEDSE